MTYKFSSGLLTIILLSSQHISAMELPFPTPEPTESVEWHDDAPDTPLKALANPYTPQSDDDLDELKKDQAKRSRRQRTSWQLPRMNNRMLVGGLAFLMLCACAAGEVPHLANPFDSPEMKMVIQQWQMRPSESGQFPDENFQYSFATEASRCLLYCDTCFKKSPRRFYDFMVSIHLECLFGHVVNNTMQCAVPGNS